MLLRETSLTHQFAIGTAIFVAVSFVASPETSRTEARPQYKSAFESLYRKGRKSKVSCEMCHGKGEKSKKVRNHYANDLAKALGKKKVKDKTEIKLALEKIEQKSCSSETYIERIKKGLTPCPHPAKKDDSRRPISIIDRYLAAPDAE